MRLLISVALYLLSLTLILLGIAERTVWAPADTKAISVEVTDPKPLLVIPYDVLKVHPGNPIITVSGPGKVFMATGRESDVNAWVGGSSKSSIAYESKSKKLEVSSVDGFVPSSDPSGSDLWRTERAADTSVSMKVDFRAQAAVIIASDGLAAAPNKVSITWHQDYDLMPSNIEIYSGFGLMLITLIYNFFILRSIRNSRRPRRRLPRAPHGPKSKPKRRRSNLPPRGRRAAGRNLAMLPATLIAVSMLAGCAPSSQNNANPTPTKTAVTDQPVALEIGQIRRIVTSVAAVAKAADEANSTALLLPRFAGAALEMRDAAYSLIKKSKKAPPVEPIYGSPLTLSLPAATDSWPRTLMVVTGYRKGTAPSMLVLRQSEPRQNYQVAYVATLSSGVKLPEVPAIDVGSVPVQPDSAYLSIAPNDLPSAYGSVIDSGSSSTSFGKFELTGDKFYLAISEEQRAQKASLTTAKLTYQHILGDAEPLGLATADGGALVAVFMKDVTTITPTKRNSGITVNELQQVALGAKGSLKGIVSTYGDMLLFYIPSVGQSTKIQLLGWQTSLLKVKSL